MKYIITVLMVIPLCYSISYSNNITDNNNFLTSGSISSTIINALEDGGCSDGSLELEIDSENGPFNIEWSNGASASSITDLYPGEYCVTVTDELCGEATGCWEIKCCPFLLDEDQIYFNIFDPACEGQKGELELSLYGIPEDAYPLDLYLENASDFTNYDFKITSSLSSFIKLSEGNYKGSVIYGDDCTASFEFKITFKPIEIKIEKTAACNDDGTITVNTQFGKLPYNYIWSDDPENHDSYREGLSSGFYHVTVQDVNNCKSSVSVYIKKGEPIETDKMSVFIGPSDCFKNTGVLEISKEPEGGSLPFYYEWSNGETGKFINELEGGEYWLTIYDDLGCTALTSFTVPVSGQPIINSDEITHTCEGKSFGEIGILASSTVGGTLAYTWNNGSTDFILEDLAADTYTVTITDQKNQCTLIKSYEVENIAVKPLIINETVKNVCESEGNNTGKITLNISGGVKPYSVLWSTGETGLSISNISTGEYSATVSDKCDNIEQLTFDINSIQLNVNIETSFPNFEEVFLEAKVNNGTPPYIYFWNTGEETFFKVDENEGTHSVTVTDQNGCSKSEETEVICDPVDFVFTTTGSCVSTFKLKIGPNSSIGPGPFLVKIEKKINQQFETVDFRQFATTQHLLNYQFIDPDLGTFRVTVTNYCGFTKTEIFNGCIDCDYHFYTVQENIFIDIMGGLLDFKLVCPCTDDCGFLGLTTDKVELILNQTALQNFSDEISGFPNFVINWPDGMTTVYHNANSGKFEINGPDHYTLTSPEFETGINVIVIAFLPFGIGEVCNLNIPIQFGKEGINGHFRKWDNSGVNPFINSEPPYNWATHACSYGCTVPLIDGILYENEPIDSEDELNYFDECSGDFSEDQVFFYEPNNYEDPCQGGGSLLTHYESVIGVVIDQKTILPNVALDEHPYWSPPMIEESDPAFPYICPPHTYEKGYCLFDSRDVYGEDVVLRDPIIASYCDGRVYDPPIDTDGDGLPDVVDPCPLNPDILCLDDDDGPGGPGGPGGGGGGGVIDENGCQTTFLPNDCQLAIICPNEEPEYIDGSLTTESYSGIEPCVHCFTASVCRVTDPNTGEEYAQVIGPVEGGVNVSLGDIPQCGNVCAILFHCSVSGEFLGYLCAADCQTSNSPLCGITQINSIISFLQEEGGPTSYEVKMTKEMVNQIIDANNAVEYKNSSDSKLRSVPNPSKNEFSVQYESQNGYESQIEIINTNSELVMTKPIKIVKGINIFKINHELAPGLYFISIKDRGRMYSIKHIIQ